MDPESRLKLSDLKENSWLQGGASMSTTPLCTPDVLESSGPTVRTYVNATYKVTQSVQRFSVLFREQILSRWILNLKLHFFCFSGF